MEQITLSAQIRNKRGKGDARRVRRQGGIPAVVYGSKEPVSLIVNELEFNKKFHTVSENTLINLKAGAQNFDVLVKDYQEDILTGKITHLDFYQVTKGKSLRTNVPIHFEGSPIGVRNGGILEHMLYEIEVECLPKDIPQNIVVDVNNLDLGESIHIEQIVAPQGVKILNLSDQVVVAITHAAKAEAAASASEEESETAEEPKEQEE